MTRYIATPSYTREILNKYQLFAKKNYGQNFLVEPSVVDKIAVNAVNKNQTVIEIGPGIGALTQMLAIHANKVKAFEIDERLIPVLKDVLADYDNVEVINEDFLNIDLKTFCEGYDDVVIAANLPYYITTPILFKIFESNANISMITVMMQKEVADRFNATVNTKDYNALSVITQYRCHVGLLMNVSKNVFNPKPNVDSAVLQFTFKNDHLVKNEEQFFELVKACFRQRRKTILNNLKEYLNNRDLTIKYLEKANIKPNTRAEALSLNEFIRLHEVISNED